MASVAREKPHRDANGSASGDGDGLSDGGAKGTGAAVGMAVSDLEGGRRMRVSSFHEDDEASARAS